MILEEKTLKEERVFDGRIITVHSDTISLPNGSTSKREVVKHGGGVCVVALDEQNNVYLVRQFRYPYKEAILEIPAGKLEKGEDPFEAMKREQQEETGTISEKYIDLGKLYPTPGYCSEIIYMWLGRITGFTEQNLDEGEFLDVEKIPLDTLVKMIMNGEIKDAKTQVAILKTHLLVSQNLI
ncbi:MAG: NUDIX hydrolase [Clostridia bacterium]